MAKAYITSLPNTTDTQRAFVKTVDSPKVPAMDYRSGFKDVATAINNTNQFLEDYSKMKYEGFQADLDKLELEHLHEMSDASDPCELEQINEKWKKNYDSALKDDFWAKSYYKSQHYKNWQARNQEAQQKIYFAKQHEFAEICATDTLNKMAETASLLDNPLDMEQYVLNGKAMLDNTKHLTADAKHKLMTNFYKDTVSRIYESDPNKAVAFLDHVGNKYDGYGVGSEEIRKKADNYNKAKAREAQADIARAQRIKENADKAIATQTKARILQNPSEAEAIIDSVSDNDSVFVNVSDWYRKGIGKNTNKDRSPLSQTITSELVSGKTPEEVYEEHPELINDPNAANALKNAIDISKKLSPSEKEDMAKQIKSEIAELDTEEKFYNYIDDPKKLTMATVYANEALKNVGKQHGWGDNDELETIKSQILTANTLDDLDKARNRIAESGLSVKEKNTLIEKANTRATSIKADINRNQENEYRQTQRDEKKEKEEFKRVSNEVEDSLSNYNDSDEFYEKAKDEWNRLTPEARRRIRARYEKLADKENKEYKNIVKDTQQIRYNQLDDMRRNGTLTQDLINEEEEKGNIDHKQANKLSNNLWNENQKDIEKQRKLDVKADKLTIYSNANKGLATNVDELKTDDDEVMRILKSTNFTVNNNNYDRKLAEIKDYIWQHPEIADNEVEKTNLIDSLIEKNINKNRSPVDDVETVLARVNKNQAGKEKSLRDKLGLKLGTPLFNNKYTGYEIKKRNAAFGELEALIDSEKDVSEEDLNRIASTYKPSKNEYYKQSRDNQETYYSLLADRDSLFGKSTKKSDDSYGGTVKREYTVLSSKAKFSDFDNYIQNLSNNYGLRSDGSEGSLTEKQYQELYKPVAMYMSEIISRSSKENTIEAYAMRKVIETLNGKGNPIDNPMSLYEVYRDVINTLEEKGAERGEKVAWFFGFTKTDIDNVVNEKMKLPKGNRYGK